MRWVLEIRVSLALSKKWFLPSRMNEMMSAKVLRQNIIFADRRFKGRLGHHGIDIWRKFRDHDAASRRLSGQDHFRFRSGPGRGSNVYNFLFVTSVTSKKSPKSIKVVQKWFHQKNKRFWHLNKKFPKNVGDLGKLIVVAGFEKLQEFQ